MFTLQTAAGYVDALLFLITDENLEGPPIKIELPGFHPTRGWSGHIWIAKKELQIIYEELLREIIIPIFEKELDYWRFCQHKS